jgi:uroporphyrinogen decarboxylase
MTSRERVIKALKGDRVDQVPVFLMSRAYSIRYARTSFRTCLEDKSGEVYAQAQYLCWKKYQYDGVMDLEGVNAESESLGCRLRGSDHESPTVEHPILRDEKDMDAFFQRAFNPETDWPITRQLNVIRNLRRKLGEDIPIYANPQCPLRSAAMLCGIERFLMDIIENPKFLHRLLEFTTQIAILYGKALIQAGADILMPSNPIGSSNMISRKQYEEFSFPYDLQMVDAFRHQEIRTILHICGDVKDRLDLIVDSGFDGVSLDSKVNLTWAKKNFGDRICLIGNVDVVDPLLFGTRDQVTAESQKCLEALGSNKSMLSAGCEISPDMPSDNLEAMIEAARSFSGQ